MLLAHSIGDFRKAGFICLCRKDDGPSTIEKLPKKTIAIIMVNILNNDLMLNFDFNFDKEQK